MHLEWNILIKLSLSLQKSRLRWFRTLFQFEIRNEESVILDGYLEEKKKSIRHSMIINWGIKWDKRIERSFPRTSFKFLCSTPEEEEEEEDLTNGVA